MPAQTTMPATAAPSRVRSLTGTLPRSKYSLIHMILVGISPRLPFQSRLKSVLHMHRGLCKHLHPRVRANRHWRTSGRHLCHCNRLSLTGLHKVRAGHRRLLDTRVSRQAMASRLPGQLSSQLGTEWLPRLQLVQLVVMAEAVAPPGPPHGPQFPPQHLQEGVHGPCSSNNIKVNHKDNRSNNTSINLHRLLGLLPSRAR
mmetsp:Transcript_47069/g.101337  ORF Transcript_47069/g.101337 Transcript_47069/m.101337 type:complete len:200 (+) Transcript_47069:337-936(+)